MVTGVGVAQISLAQINLPTPKIPVWCKNGDDDDDIDAAPAERAHTSSSATSTSAAGEDVSTSTQPSVTNAAELCDACLIERRSGVGSYSRLCGNCVDTFRDGQRLPT